MGEKWTPVNDPCWLAFKEKHGRGEAERTLDNPPSELSFDYERRDKGTGEYLFDFERPEHTYIATNENFISEARAILHNQLPSGNSGLYLSVRAERGLQGAYLAGAKGLLLINATPVEYLFNKVNLELFRMARNLKDYKDLRRNPDNVTARFSQDASDYVKRLIKFATESQPIARKSIKFWDSYANSPEMHRLAEAQNAAQTTGLGTHYLNNERAFNYLKRLVNRRQIGVVSLYLGHTMLVRVLANWLRHFPDKVSVLDIETAWMFRHTGVEFAACLDELKPCFGPRTIMLADHDQERCRYEGWKKVYEDVRHCVSYAIDPHTPGDELVHRMRGLQTRGPIYYPFLNRGRRRS
ncbi:MAG: hypothetical protein AAF355_09995 [Myxococcota bacterium]